MMNKLFHIYAIPLCFPLYRLIKSTDNFYTFPHIVISVEKCWFAWFYHSIFQQSGCADPCMIHFFPHFSTISLFHCYLSTSLAGGYRWKSIQNTDLCPLFPIFIVENYFSYEIISIYFPHFIFSAERIFIQIKFT